MVKRAGHMRARRCKEAKEFNLMPKPMPRLDANCKVNKVSRLQQYITNDPTSHYYSSGFPFRVFSRHVKRAIIPKH
jgi:hypothetical protein